MRLLGAHTSLLLVLSACLHQPSRVWTISYMPGQGAVIGYARGNSDQAEAELTARMRDVEREVCGTHEIHVVQDVLASQDRQVTLMLPTTSQTRIDGLAASAGSASIYGAGPGGGFWARGQGASGTAFSATAMTTQYAPSTFQVTDYWRERLFMCDEAYKRTREASAQGRPTPATVPSAGASPAACCDCLADHYTPSGLCLTQPKLQCEVALIRGQRPALSSSTCWSMCGAACPGGT